MTPEDRQHFDAWVEELDRRLAARTKIITSKAPQTPKGWLRAWWPIIAGAIVVTGSVFAAVNWLFVTEIEARVAHEEIVRDVQENATVNREQNIQIDQQGEVLDEIKHDVKAISRRLGVRGRQ